MKWFAALSEDSPRFNDYAEMLQVAVLTAQERTQLHAHVLYDGRENSFTRWLRDRHVEVWSVRSRFYPRLATLPEEMRPFAAGAYLRVEIPTLAARFGAEDKYALYTDVDVIFTRDPGELLRGFAPRYFAIAPQRHATDGINSGVMLMNLPRLRRDAPSFFAFVERHLPRFTRAADQEAYEEFYSWAHPPMTVRRVTRRLGWGSGGLWDRLPIELNPDPLWDPLPLELNWKAYWPSNENAAILHFHGPKPHDRERCLRQQCPPHIQELATCEYYAACNVWQDAYSQVASAT